MTMVYHFQKRWSLKFRRDPDAGRVMFIGPLVLSLDVVRRQGSPHAYEPSRPREWIANRLLGLATWVLPANHPASDVIWDAAWTVDDPAWMTRKEAAMRKRKA
jgi:hypothetical protein